MTSSEHLSTNVCRRNVGHATHQCTRCELPLRFVTGATPAYFCIKASPQSTPGEPGWGQRNGLRCGGDDNRAR